MGGCYIRQEGKNVLFFFTLGWVLAEAPKKMFFKKRVLYVHTFGVERKKPFSRPAFDTLVLCFVGLKRTSFFYRPVFHECV